MKAIRLDCISTCVNNNVDAGETRRNHEQMEIYAEVGRT